MVMALSAVCRRYLRPKYCLINELAAVSSFYKFSTAADLVLPSNALVEGISATDVKKHIERNPQLAQFVASIRQYGITESQIINAIASEPLILQYNLQNALSVIEILMQLGFHNETVVSMIEKYPNLLSYTKDRIVERIEAWKVHHFGTPFVLHMFTEHPHIIAVNGEVLDRRIPLLHHYLDRKIGRVTRLLVNCPDVLYQDWKHVEQKFHYLLMVMKVGDKQLSDSKAMSCTYDFIKQRHTFLEKVGVYRTPSDKDKGFAPHTNPKLSQITDTDDEVFAKNVAKVSLEEYQVYKDLQKYMPQEEERFLLTIKEERKKVREEFRKKLKRKNSWAPMYSDDDTDDECDEIDADYFEDLDDSSK